MGKLWIITSKAYQDSKARIAQQLGISRADENVYVEYAVKCFADLIEQQGRAGQGIAATTLAPALADYSRYRQLNDVQRKEEEKQVTIGDMTEMLIQEQIGPALEKLNAAGGISIPNLLTAKKYNRKLIILVAVLVVGADELEVG